MPTVIYIDNQGNLSGLADDTLDKLTLGPKTVERISNIEYDHEQAEWVAEDMQGHPIAAHTIRGQVIELERAFLNRQIEAEFALRG
jgi:hypothetical protein